MYADEHLNQPTCTYIIIILFKAQRLIQYLNHKARTDISLATLMELLLDYKCTHCQDFLMLPASVELQEWCVSLCVRTAEGADRAESHTLKG